MSRGQSRKNVSQERTFRQGKVLSAPPKSAYRRHHPTPLPSPRINTSGRTQIEQTTEALPRSSETSEDLRNQLQDTTSREGRLPIPHRSEEPRRTGRHPKERRRADAGQDFGPTTRDHLGPRQRTSKRARTSEDKELPRIQPRNGTSQFWYVNVSLRCTNSP